MRLRSWERRVCAAALAVLLAGAGVALGAMTAPAAQAAGGYCAGAGVNVTVDFTGQGGGIAKGCAPHGAGGTAWDAFQAAGFPLTSVQRYPGAVCRVSGRPASASCQNMPPADAYWGFFTSHGNGWSYASVGPASYTVSNGDTVGFAWQTGSKRQPAAAPAQPVRSSPPSKPSPQPGAKASAKPAPAHAAVPRGTAPTTHAAPRPRRAGATTAPSGGTTRQSHPAARRTHAASAATPSPSASTSATSATAAAPSAAVAARPVAAADRTRDTSTGGGVPVWIPVVVLVVLAAGGGAAAWRRRTAVR